MNRLDQLIARRDGFGSQGADTFVPIKMGDFTVLLAVADAAQAYAECKTPTNRDNLFSALKPLLEDA